MPGLNQKRSANAWQAVEQWKASGQSQGKYKTWAVKLPALILNSGLLPALAFLNAKGNEQAEVGEKCMEWLKDQTGGASVIPWTHDNNRIIVRLQSENSRVYRVAQAEALRWAAWCKRYAEGYLEGQED